MTKMTITMTHDDGQIEVKPSQSACQFLEDSFYGCLERHDHNFNRCRSVYHTFLACQMLCRGNSKDCQEYLERIGKIIPSQRTSNRPVDD